MCSTLRSAYWSKFDEMILSVFAFIGKVGKGSQTGGARSRRAQPWLPSTLTVRPPSSGQWMSSLWTRLHKWQQCSHEFTIGWAFELDCAGFYYSPYPNKYYHMWEMSHGQIMYLCHCLWWIFCLNISENVKWSGLMKTFNFHAIQPNDSNHSVIA